MDKELRLSALNNSFKMTWKTSGDLMKGYSLLFIIGIFMCFNSFAIADDRVVVIPLHSTSKLLVTNKYQVQYPLRETIIDTTANLMWQQSHGGYFPLSSALSYCDTLGVGGFNDWRVPTKEELKSLVVCTNDTLTPLPDFASCGAGTYDRPTLDLQFYLRSYGYTFWTSTMNNEFVWQVDFFDGTASLQKPGSSADVRCVRTNR